MGGSRHAPLSARRKHRRQHARPPRRARALLASVVEVIVDHNQTLGSTATTRAIRSRSTLGNNDAVNDSPRGVCLQSLGGAFLFFPFSLAVSSGRFGLLVLEQQGSISIDWNSNPLQDMD
jgi:hypothetical protein